MSIQVSTAVPKAARVKRRFWEDALRADGHDWLLTHTIWDVYWTRGLTGLTEEDKLTMFGNGLSIRGDRAHQLLLLEDAGRRGFLLAVPTGYVIGYPRMLPEVTTAMDQVCIYFVFVRPEFRHQGVMHALRQRLEELVADTPTVVWFESRDADIRRSIDGYVFYDFQWTGTPMFYKLVHHHHQLPPQ